MGPVWNSIKMPCKWPRTDIPGDKPAHHAACYSLNHDPDSSKSFPEVSKYAQQCRVTAFCLEHITTLSLSNAAHVLHKTATQAHSRAFPKKQYANSVSLAKLGPAAHPNTLTKETKNNDTDCLT